MLIVQLKKYLGGVLNKLWVENRHLVKEICYAIDTNRMCTVSVQYVGCKLK